MPFFRILNFLPIFAIVIIVLFQGEMIFLKFTIKKEDIQNRALASFWGGYQCLILIESVLFIALIGFGYYSFTNQFATFLWTVALVFVVCVGIYLGLKYNSLYHMMQSDFKRLSKDGILECELLRE